MNIMTLKEFSDNIIRPSVIAGIESGRFDAILLDSDILEIIGHYGDLLEAFKARMEKLKC